MAENSRVSDCGTNRDCSLSSSLSLSFHLALLFSLSHSSSSSSYGNTPSLSSRLFSLLLFFTNHPPLLHSLSRFPFLLFFSMSSLFVKALQVMNNWQLHKSLIHSCNFLSYRRHDQSIHTVCLITSNFKRNQQVFSGSSCSKASYVKRKQFILFILAQSSMRMSWYCSFRANQNPLTPISNFDRCVSRVATFCLLKITHNIYT